MAPGPSSAAAAIGETDPSMDLDGGMPTNVRCKLILTQSPILRNVRNRHSTHKSALRLCGASVRDSHIQSPSLVSLRGE